MKFFFAKVCFTACTKSETKIIKRKRKFFSVIYSHVFGCITTNTIKNREKILKQKFSPL